MKQPVNPFHPGEILLEEFLQPAGMTQTAFAEKLGWTRARLNEFIRGIAAAGGGLDHVIFQLTFMNVILIPKPLFFNELHFVIAHFSAIFSGLAMLPRGIRPSFHDFGGFGCEGRAQMPRQF